jgi:GT2 family glycosyltransferase
MKKPLVSVVITNWNRKNDLRECLESIKNQTYKNNEIIVVDNYSTDGSIEIVTNEFPEVKLIVMPDSSYGACETFNIGFVNSTGEYVIVMDNDALLEKDWIEKAIIEFENDEKLGCVAGRVLNYYTKEDWGFWIYGLEDGYKDKEFYTTVFVGCSALIKKKILDEVGGYPKEYFLYWNDVALGAEVVNHGYKIKYVPNIVAYHKVSGTQRPGRKGYYYLVRNGYWYYWRYYPLDLAIKCTLIHFIKSGWVGVKYPITFIKAHLCAIKELPAMIRKRDPIKDVNILKALKF